MAVNGTLTVLPQLMRTSFHAPSKISLQNSFAKTPRDLFLAVCCSLRVSLDFILPFPRGHRFTSSIASSSSFRNGRTSPETDCPVPLDQQPVNEYQSLSQAFPFSWASSDLFEYCSRLIATGASFGLFVGLPVAWFGVANPESEPLNCALGAVSTGLFAVTLAVVRMYLGWSYVGNRLLSAVVESLAVKINRYQRQKSLMLLVMEVPNANRFPSTVNPH